MANIQFTNFARATLAIGAAPGATSLTLAAGKGALFPTLTGAQYFYVTLENSSLSREIVKVTARTGDNLTVVRAQDNTSALTWNAGDVCSLRFNAAAITEAVVGTLLAANNLSDVVNAATARANLGAAASGPIGSSGITGAAVAGALGSSGITGAAASGANTDITSVATTTTINGTVIGYRDVPLNAQNAGYTLVLGDAGKFIYFNTVGAFTIPANASVAFPVGTAISFVNVGAASTIAITTDTLRQVGTGATGTRTLAQWGMATVLKVNSTTWFISGAGLS